jgi:O-antigen/teichoic acid export membrane protein
VIGLPALLIIALAAPFVFQIIFGEGWGNSARFIQILAPMFFLQFLGSPISVALDVMERQDLQAVREIIRLVLLASAAFFSSFIGLEATGWITLFSAATSIAYLVTILLSFLAIRAALSAVSAGKYV